MTETVIIGLQISKNETLSLMQAIDMKFVADSMLGKLAKWLRLIGQDTVYVRDADDNELVRIALRRDSMDTFEAIKHRRSIRAYKPDPIPEEVLDDIIAAGFCAPAAHGKLPWHVIVIRDAELRKHLSETHSWAGFIEQAPVTLAICVDRNESEVFWVEDGSAMTENILLAAAAKGLGTCWIGIHGAVYGGVDSEDTVRGILGIPKHVGVLALTPLGYPAEEKQAYDFKLPEGRVHRDRFGK